MLQQTTVQLLVKGASRRTRLLTTGYLRHRAAGSLCGKWTLGEQLPGWPTRLARLQAQSR